ncbi:MAG TPA: potassium channel family protein [Cyclobacteriaceae bacterium]|nr:potassium channel family protein [Cyclobacteriaceae bacterium]
MAEIVCLIIGIFLIIVIFRDILFTTYSMEGGGELTDFFLKHSWFGLLWLCGGDGRKKLLNYAGMFMMISLIVLWSLGLWLGVFLLFASDPSAIVHSDTLQHTDLWEKAYFSGYVLTTMGLGDYMPINAYWGILSAVFSFFGLLFITLMVSYAVPVLSNVITKKQLSLFVQQHGDSPAALIDYLWNGKDFSRLEQFRQQLQQSILTIAQSYRAYPILHYFHTNKQNESLIVTLCMLDETLAIMQQYISPEQWEEKELLPLQKAIDHYLNTMRDTYGYAEDESTEIPSLDLQMLSKMGIRWNNNSNFDWQRKQLWSRLLNSKGWTWKEVYPTQQAKVA